MIPRLKELYENKMLMEDYCPTGVMTATNVDDIFKGLSANEIKEVCVDREEMIMITMFMVVNSMKNYELTNKVEINWLVWRILSEGKVKKFLGVKLNEN